MSRKPLEILYEDNHLLVVNKPPGLATVGVAEDEPSVAKLAKQYLKQRYDKPGNVYLGVVSRLDKLVSGVLVFARTSKAAARLNDQFRERDVAKTYWAIVEPAPPAQQGECDDWIYKDEAHQRMAIGSAQSRDAKQALLEYRVLRRRAQSAWLEVDLHSGRKHQIRVQLSHRGWPVLGDRKYGSRETLVGGQAIALHARELQIAHPVGQAEIAITAPCPAFWRELGVEG